MSPVTQNPQVKLNDGHSIPQVGFGVFQIPDDETQQAVEHALEAGYRHIDTAAAYGNEAAVGAGLRASGLPRDDVFVTTKLRNGDHSPDAARAAFERSREALGLDVVDLYLLHWPVPSEDLYVPTWRVLEQLQQEGLVRSIGVSNFLPEHLQRLTAETDVVPAVNQVEIHPTFQQPATQRAARDAGLVLEAYSPLGQGQDLHSEPVTAAAREHGVDAGQVVLRWLLQQGVVVLPKSTTPSRIVSNLDLFGFELSDDEVRAISALDSLERIGSDPATFADSQEPPRSA